MGTFIADGAAVLPAIKTDARSPSGATTEWASVDANEVRSALLDLRIQALLDANRIAAKQDGAVGVYPTKAEFDALIAKLTAAGLMSAT